MIDLPPFDALALTLHHSPGVHAMLLGSGLSRSAGIPTGWEITLDLIRRLGALDGLTDHDDWPKWYVEKYGKVPSYSEILDSLASTQAERRSILQSYIEAASGEEVRQPTKAHHSIARLVASGKVKVLITTNFDRLLEGALRAEGIEPTVIANDDAVAGATPLVHSQCTIVKVHGDFLDARIKNTDPELAEYSLAMNDLLDQIFDNFGLVVVGWSGDWDTALRNAILRAPNRRYPMFWASRGMPSALATDILDKRGARSIPITDADSFLQKLEHTVAALETASSPHPQTVHAALALARRLCRDDRYAMEWAEFLHAEVLKIREYVLGSDYPTASPTTKSLNEMVKLLVSTSETLRRSAMICGRWGTPDANRALTRAIADLNFSVQPRGGFNYLIAMQQFPASITFYWCLGGLIDAERWPEVHALMESTISVDNRSVPMAAAFPFATYDTVDWKFLEGLETRHTPISDYLVGLFQSEAAQDIVLLTTRGEALFDELEMMVALAFAYRRVKLSADTGLWFWIPLGRFIWRNQGGGLESKMQGLEADRRDAPIYSAGMLGGSAEAAAATFAKIREFRKEVGSRFR